MRASYSVSFLIILCGSLHQYSRGDNDVYSRYDEDGIILLWHELKAQLQHIEKDRASDLQRIKRLENDNEKLRIEVSDLRTILQKGNRNETSFRQHRSAEADSAEKSVEFLPVLQDGTVNEVELLNEANAPRSIDLIKLVNDQEKKIDWLIGIVNDLGLKLGECCANSTAFQSIPVEIAYSPTDLERLKKRVHEIDVSVMEIQVHQRGMQDDSGRTVFQITHINNELKAINEERKHMWVILRRGDILGDPDQNNWEFSGEESSGWQPVPFIEQTAATAHGSKMRQVERTANEAFSMVTQMRTKVDVIEKDITKALVQLDNLDKSRMNQSRFIVFTTTMEFVQEALFNLTHYLMEIESIQEKDTSQMQSELIDIAKRLRLLSLQTDKAKHLAQVVKDRQMDHFSAIQKFREDLNAMETSVLKLGIKLSNFQADVLNATMINYKNDNKDLQQNVQIAELYNRMERIDGKFPEIHQTLKDVLTSLRSKADRGEVKLLGADILAAAEKLQITSSLNDSLNSLNQAVRLLETQLPTDCSLSSSLPNTASTGPSGTYLIKPSGSPKAVLVYCELEPALPSNTGALTWTVIQRRNHGHVDFNRTWDQYRYGFGDLNGDYWLGNEYIHLLTRRDALLRIDAWDIFGDYHFAEYGTFKVDSFEGGFKLEIGNYSGNLTDALRHHNGMRFSAFDTDLDSSSTHCARFYASGWWFSNCQKANLNGRYPMGVVWFSSSVNNWIQLEKTVMKVRLAK